MADNGVAFILNFVKIRLAYLQLKHAYGWRQGQVRPCSKLSKNENKVRSRAVLHLQFTVLRYVCSIVFFFRGKYVIKSTKYFKPPQMNVTEYEGCRLFIDFHIYCLRAPVRWEPSQIKPRPTLLKAVVPPGYRVNMPAVLCITTPTHFQIERVGWAVPEHRLFWLR